MNRKRRVALIDDDDDEEEQQQRAKRQKEGEPRTVGRVIRVSRQGKEMRKHYASFEFLGNEYEPVRFLPPLFFPLLVFL